MAEALEGIVVLDLTAYIAGPYACALLGDVGAEVIKIEPPGGDMTRQYPSTLDECRTFLGVNRNKRSVVLDLKNQNGRAAFYRLVEKADVVVQNFRPSVPKKLGIDYDTLRALRPELIYCSFTGYGEDGPLCGHPGYDTMLQCFTGLAWMQGVATDSGHPEVLSGSIVDYYSASTIAFGILSALIHRLRTGEGQHVRASLLQSAIALQAGQFIWAESEPRNVNRWWPPSYSGIYPTKDGHVFLQATTPTFWKSLCEHLGFPELAEDPRYDTLKKRTDLKDEIRGLIKNALMQHTALEWEHRLLGKVPLVAVRSIENMFDHPQVLAEELVVEHEHPRVGKYRSMGKAVKMGVGNRPTTRAPMLGEHTDEVLTRFGFSEHEVAVLRASGAAA